MSDTEDEIIPKRKKGIKNTISYKRNVIRNARVHGEAYTNYVGKQVSSIEYNAHCECKKMCLESLTTEAKQKMLDNFLKITTKNEQDIHLQRMIEFQEIKRKKPRIETPESSRKPKSRTIKYSLLHGGVRKPVCKQAFLSVHGVNKKRIERIVKLLAADMNPVDMRGKNASGNTIPEQVRQRVYDHISYSPTHLNHFTGKPMRYLDRLLMDSLEKNLN